MQPSTAHPFEAEATANAFYPWEAELVASLERLRELQQNLEAHVSRLRGLESELVRLRPAQSVA